MNMNNETKVDVVLLPCPFCNCGGHRRWNCKLGEESCMLDEVQCSNPRCILYQLKTYPTVEQWNARPTSQPAEPTIKEPDLQEMAMEVADRLIPVRSNNDWSVLYSCAEQRLAKAYEAGFKAGKESNGK